MNVKQINTKIQSFVKNNPHAGKDEIMQYLFNECGVPFSGLQSEYKRLRKENLVPKATRRKANGWLNLMATAIGGNPAMQDDELIEFIKKHNSRIGDPGYYVRTYAPAFRQAIALATSK